VGEVPGRSQKWFNALSDRKVVDVRPDGVYFEKVKTNLSRIDYVVYDYNGEFLKPKDRNANSLRLRALEMESANASVEVYANDYVAIRKNI
jgi:hypothetical protein